MVIEWQQVLHCCLFWAMSWKVLSHCWGESRGPQPGKRQVPASAKSFVIVFIFDCHVSCWPSWDFFQLDPRVANITFCVKRFSSVRRSWPSHRIRACWMISAKFLALSVDLKILWRTTSLVIFCFQQIFRMVLRHLWSKTCSRWRSSERIDHVSQPYTSVGRKVQLYTRHFVNKDMSVRRQRWRKFPNTTRALEILDVISSVMFPITLIQSILLFFETFCRILKATMLGFSISKWWSSSVSVTDNRRSLWP